MVEAILRFFSTDGFMPHGTCYLWRPGVLSLHVISDALIGLSYYSIPFTLAYFMRRRKDLEFNWIIGCFAVFIIACGSTHLMAVLTVWHPYYWIAGTIKAVTAAASVPTAVLLVKLMPEALRWPSPVSLRQANEELQRINAKLISEIRERERAQTEARLANHELERQLLQRAQDEQSLREARDAADFANRSKGRFLATASHDLRQPLQTLALLNGSLRRMSQRGEVSQVLMEQEEAIVSMSRLINMLLDISKLESGAVRPEIRDFSLESSFQEIRIEFNGIAQKKGLSLEVATARETAASDPTLLGQILRNLVSNAIRYTPRGVVRVRCERDGADRVRIDVEDSGIGIAEEHLAHIFEEFYQVGVSPNTVREGHGLGLSIVQRTAKLLSHELRVQSRLGRGTTFSIVLPAGVLEHSGPAEAAQPAGTNAAPNAHILVVDDDPAVLNATRMLLKVEGFEVSTAPSLAEAVRVSAEHRDIGILITDYHLGNGDLGTQVIDAVRGVIGVQVRAVLVSGDTSGVIRSAVLDPRVRLASKPIVAEELLRIVFELNATGENPEGQQSVSS